MKRHEYQFDEIAVGSGLNAAAYAYLNSVPLIINRHNPPFKFDEIELDDFGKIPQTKLWNQLLFFLSLSGLCPLSDKVENCRIEDEDILKVTTKKSRAAQFKFNKLVIFDDENFSGLDAPTKINSTYRVIDWINVRSGAIHEFDRIDTESDFVKCVYFYKSERIPGTHSKKDVAALSYLSYEQLQDYKYSDTYARFVVRRMMKEHGIRGRKNGRNPNDLSKHKYHDIKLEAARRDVEKLFMDDREDTETIKFSRATPAEIFSQFEKTNNCSERLRTAVLC